MKDFYLKFERDTGKSEREAVLGRVRAAGASYAPLFPPPFEAPPEWPYYRVQSPSKRVSRALRRLLDKSLELTYITEDVLALKLGARKSR